MLSIEVAAAVYDDFGTCAVALMVEKMPDLAYVALNQFLVEDKPTRTNYYHLCALEYDTRCKTGKTPARSVLEVNSIFHTLILGASKIILVLTMKQLNQMPAESDVIQRSKIGRLAALDLFSSFLGY